MQYALKSQQLQEYLALPPRVLILSVLHLIEPLRSLLDSIDTIMQFESSHLKPPLT